MLRVAGAAFAYRGGRPVFEGLDLALGRGEVLCVLGPNGVGKSTLLRCLAGLERLSAGRVEVGGEGGGGGRGRIGYVPQSERPVFAFTVRTMVEMGRAPHLSWLALPGARDAAVVERVVARLGLSHLASRPCTELSGGERQLVSLARALAQEPGLLVLDEPTSQLDFANQAGVLELLRGLAGEGLAVVMTTHDPDHAFLIADQVLVMGRDRPPLSGPPGSVLTETVLSAVYGRAIRVITAGDRTLCFADHATRQK